MNIKASEAIKNPSLSLNDTYSKKAFYYFLFIAGIQGLLGRVIGYFLPIYFEQLGYSGVHTGIYFTFASLSTIIMSLPMGITTDKKPIAYIFMLSFFIIGLSYVGFIISNSFIIFCLFAFFRSFGMRFFNTAKQSMFFKISKNDTPVESGQYQFANFLFMGVGMLVGAFIISRFSFRHAFITVAISNFVLIIFSYFVPRTETVAIKIEEYKKAIFTPKILFLVVIFFLSSLHWGAENVSYSMFLKNSLGLDIQGTGIYTGLGFFFVGIGAYLGVILVQKKIIKNLETILIIGFFMGGLFHILMCVNNLYISFFFRVLHEIGDGLVFLAFFYGISKIFHVSTVGGCAAFITLWMGIGNFSGSILFGYIGDTWGNHWSLIVSGIILMFIPLLIYLRKKVVM